jgi:Spy/CpxP family protein refolding chaperone
MRSLLAVVLGGGLLASTVMAGPAFAQHRGGPASASGDGGVLVFLLRGASLSAEQQSRVRDIMGAHRARSEATIRQLRTAQEELTDRLLGPGPVQMQDLEPRRQRTAQLWERLAEDRLVMALEVRGVLTPEQVAKVAQLKDRYRALRAEMRELLEGKR